MNIRKFAGILSISILSIMLVAASAAAQEDVPKLPMIADGDVKINGQPAPVNTIVTAYDGVKYLGTVKLIAEGVFEEKNILTISEPSGEIQFLIQTPTMTKSVKAQQTFDNWKSGENTHLSLTATYVPGTNSGADISSSGGGRGSSGTISSSGNDDSVAGGSGDNAVSAKEKTQTSSEDLAPSTGSDGSEGSGFSMLLLLLAVIIIAAVGVMYYIRSKNL